MTNQQHTVSDVWDIAVQQFGAQPCMTHANTGRTFTFNEIDMLSNRVGNWAVQQGWQPGDCVALFMENRPEYVAVWLGLSKAGITIALLNNTIKMNAIVHCASVASAKAMIFGSELTDNVAAVAQVCHLLVVTCTPLAGVDSIHPVPRPRFAGAARRGRGSALQCDHGIRERATAL